MAFSVAEWLSCKFSALQLLTLSPSLFFLMVARVFKRNKMRETPPDLLTPRTSGWWDWLGAGLSSSASCEGSSWGTSGRACFLAGLKAILFQVLWIRGPLLEALLCGRCHCFPEETLDLHGCVAAGTVVPEVWSLKPASSGTTSSRTFSLTSMNFPSQTCTPVALVLRPMHRVCKLCLLGQLPLGGGACTRPPVLSEPSLPHLAVAQPALAAAVPPRFPLLVFK